MSWFLEKLHSYSFNFVLNKSCKFHVHKVSILYIDPCRKDGGFIFFFVCVAKKAIIDIIYRFGEGVL